MEYLGWFTLIVIALVVLIALIVLIRSIPDIRRYLKIKAM